MGRKREGVTLLNASQVYRYFQAAFEKPLKMNSLLKNTESSISATDELNQIPKYLVCSPSSYKTAVNSRNPNKGNVRLLMEGEEVVDYSALEGWVLKYISDEGWRKCLNNIRQKKHARENRYSTTQLRISSYAHLQLKDIALTENVESFDSFLLKLSDVLKECKENANDQELTTLEYIRKLNGSK